MVTPSQHVPQFVVKRKRKRPTYIDPCLGFYALPQSSDPNDDPFLDTPKEPEPDTEQFQLQSIDVDLPRIETLSVEEDSVGGSEDTVESPKQAVEISVDSFLRSFNKEKTKPYPTYKLLKVKKLKASIDELEPPLPLKRNPRRVTVSSSPPSDEPVDQLFNDDGVTRKKPLVKRQRKVSFAQRLLQAAIVSEVDPGDTLLDGVKKPALPNSLFNSNQIETQQSKRRRRLLLIDPRKRDCRPCSFSSSSTNVERKLPLTRWPTQISAVSDEEEDWLTGVEVEKRLKPMSGVKRRKMSTSTRQARNSLLFVPLQEAENGWTARKKGKGSISLKQSLVLGGKGNALGLTMIPTHSSTHLGDAAMSSEPAQPVTVIQSLLQPISTAMNSIAPAHDQEYEPMSTFAPATMLNTVSPSLSPKISIAMKAGYSSTDFSFNKNTIVDTQVKVPSAVMLSFPLNTCVNSSEDRMPPLPQRPLSSFFDEFFKTAKDVGQLTGSVKRQRRERQQPTLSSSSRCFNTQSTEPLFEESELVPQTEPEPEVDVLETIKTRSCSQYDVVLTSSPLEAVPGPEHKEIRRPNTGVRRSMAGLWAFCDVGL
ncbi:hypothetical protein L218DRAFT_1073918 [Marasmius fiardii PR-910]|nr:hypothetical protein L218DRAFT_1073918 [Marasmius fiardii PR-910]